MQDQKTAGQAEDWELSEAYYKEDTGKKELRLEDFLEEETAEGQSGTRTAKRRSATSSGCSGENITPFFGKSAMIRYVSGIDQPIYPIAYIKNKIPMAKKAGGYASLLLRYGSVP